MADWITATGHRQTNDMKITQVFVYLAIPCAGLLDLHKKALRLLITDGYDCRYDTFDTPENVIEALKTANPTLIC